MNQKLKIKNWLPKLWHKIKTNWQVVLTILALILFVALVGGFVYWQVGGQLSQVSSLDDLRFPSTYDQPLIIKLADLAISITPLGALPAQAQTEKNIVRYINAFTNTDVVQTKYSNKIKEDIILKQPGHPEIFEYQIDLTKYDFSKDADGNLIFYQKNHKGDEAFRSFYIPAPFLIDDNGQKSSTQEVSFDLADDGRLTLKPSAEWLKKAKYPVILDPTIEISVINIHSSPQQGENWTVNFTTKGTADLKIIPNDQGTIDDDEFVSLSCGSKKVTPRILAGDIISYSNWSCAETATVVHYTKKAGNHTLRFEFGEAITYAYNTNPAFSATGGIVTQSGGYNIHTFTTKSFVDSETTPKTITVNGDAMMSTTQSKFGGASAYFDGTGDYLSVPDGADWNFGSGDFTIDYWVRPAQVSSQMAAFSQEESDYYPAIFSEIVSSQFRWVMRTAGGADIFDMYSSGVTPVANTWYHVALVKNGTSYKMYIDGIQRGSTTSSTVMEDVASPFIVGGRPTVGGFYWNGYIDEFRISKGLARWTSDFSASLPTAYTSDANTNLLLHAENSLTVTGSGNVEYLVVAGGGGGGGSPAYTCGGGGGGAGGLLYSASYAVTVGVKTVTVGGGGAGGAAGANKGTNGANSVFGIITATGGGGGAAGEGSPNGIGLDGGSGGGAGDSSGYVTSGNGTAGQGNNGGYGVHGGAACGGGGGAGAVGSNGIGVNPNIGGNGGAGLQYSQFSGSGSPAGWFAGGGGGGFYANGVGGNIGGLGGNGGGGSAYRAGTSGNANGDNATANTGGGGGGATVQGGTAAGGNGGSGIVIVKYIPVAQTYSPVVFRSAYVAPIPGIDELSATGGTITYTDSNGANPRSSPAYTGGYTVHTFTATGNSTFTVTGSGNVDYLVVGGGGGGGCCGTYGGGGGGGAGGLLTSTTAVSAGAITVTVGSNGSAGNSGGNSVFNSITAYGGGRGGVGGGAAGSAGGSGGGGNPVSGSGGAGTSGQGYRGGNVGTLSQGDNGSGGGGGAGGQGTDAPWTNTGQAGGPGVASSISGSSVTYAAGGNGGDGVYWGNGDVGATGAANTGTGGGGAGYNGTAGAGGSGIVIVRYKPATAVAGVPGVVGQPIIFRSAATTLLLNFPLNFPINFPINFLTQSSGIPIIFK